MERRELISLFSAFSSLFSSFHIDKDFLNFFFEIWQIFFNRFPNGLQIYPKVMMYQFIPHPRNVFPWDICIFSSKAGWNVFSSLSNNFYLPDNGILLFLYLFS